MSLGLMFKRFAKFLNQGVPIINKTANINTLFRGKSLMDMRIVITGGGSGLGLAMARKFVSEGARVLIAGRREAVLKRAAEDIGCCYTILDVSKPETFDGFYIEAQKKLGHIDVLVNNAGISLHEPSFFDVTPEGFDQQIATNLKGAFFMTQYYIKDLINNHQSGNVLFISSESGDTDDCRPYGYTKTATNSMVRGLAYLFKNEGIRINAIAPGITASDMTGVRAEGNLYAGNYGQGRFYLPIEIAEVACFLLSPISDCISGQIITCNNAQTVNARWR